MNQNHSIRQPRRRAPIKTSFMELIDALSRMTKDDTRVISIINTIFSSYTVRFDHTLAPIRLVDERKTIGGPRRARMGARA